MDTAAAVRTLSFTAPEDLGQFIADDLAGIDPAVAFAMGLEVRQAAEHCYRKPGEFRMAIHRPNADRVAELVAGYGRGFTVEACGTWEDPDGEYAKLTIHPGTPAYRADAAA